MTGRARYAASVGPAPRSQAHAPCRSPSSSPGATPTEATACTAGSAPPVRHHRSRARAHDPVLAGRGELLRGEQLRHAGSAELAEVRMGNGGQVACNDLEQDGPHGLEQRLTEHSMRGCTDEHLHRRNVHAIDHAMGL
eukprot:scaffold66899_cov64-Phaeocystis_antarctica.AAC.7